MMKSIVLKNHVTFLNLFTKDFCKFFALPCGPLFVSTLNGHHVG